MNMPGRKSTSLRQHAIKYTLITFVVIFLAALLHYVIFSHYLHELDDKERHKSLLGAAHSISRSIGFYQNIVDTLSQQHTVIDLIQFASNEKVQEWSNEMQRMLPESIGFTVFDHRGKAKGIPSELRLSKSCLLDMQKKFMGLNIATPPVHHKIQGLEHFDIVAPVMQEGEYIGLVFSSFSLRIVEQLLTNLETDNRAYRILTQDGYKVASTGGFDSAQGEVYREGIKGTDWYIEMSVLNKSENILVTSLLISNVITFILVSIILYFAMNRLFSIVLKDFEILSWMMARIRDDDFNKQEIPRTALKETRGIVRFIRFTADELSNYQKKLKHDSSTDELTGLYNRRVLSHELDNCLNLATQGHSIHVVILDLDFFKEINDNYGHHVGDHVLILLAEALNRYCRETDICTRAGGDEFIVILLEYSLEEVRSWYADVQSYMQQHITKYNADQNITIQFGISAGCTLIRNNDISSVVLKRADDALYRVKSAGRNFIECL